MIQGKVASIHIRQTDVHIVEADVDKKSVNITNAFTIRNFQRFFSRGRLINMSSMVDAITMAMHTNGVTANRLMICFEDVFETEFDTEPITATETRRERIKGLFNSGKKQKSEDASAENEDILGVASSATIIHKHSWGKYITREEQGETVSTTTAERDMVDSMVAAFTAGGFNVISVEPPQTVLVYARNIIEYSYDNINKIVINSEDGESGTAYIMTKDVPSIIKPIRFDSLEGFDLEEKIVNFCVHEMNVAQMRNPLVFLTGAAIQSVDDYISIADHLESEDLHAMDLYALVDNTEYASSAINIHVTDNTKKSDGIEELRCEFGICICQVLRCFDEKPENLYEGRSGHTLSPKDKLQIATLAKIIAAAFMVINIGLTVSLGFEAVSIKHAITNSDSLKEQLNRIELQRDNAQIQLQALSVIDTRIEDVFKFILENIDSTLNIASVDTIDMIPGNEGSVSSYDDTSSSEQEEDGEESDGKSTDRVEKQLIVRGYSKKSSGPIELYNAFNNANVGEVKLVGHQQMLLPSGETIYAFELSIG